MNYLIPFSKGLGVVVDWDFTNPIHCFNWHEDKDGYAITTPTFNYKFRKTIKMHRMLTGFSDKQVDHINGIPNDNRNINLRIVTPLQNSQNHNRHRSGEHLVGTSYRPEMKKWRAWTKAGGKRVTIGYYDNQIEAHLAYKMYMRGL